MDSAYRKRWTTLAFEMDQRIDAEQSTVDTLREQGDANFLIHQGRVMELETLKQRMAALASNFPEEAESDTTINLSGVSETTMEEIVRRVRESMGQQATIGAEHQSFDDFRAQTIVP